MSNKVVEDIKCVRKNKVFGRLCRWLVFILAFQKWTVFTIILCFIYLLMLQFLFY